IAGTVMVSGTGTAASLTILGSDTVSGDLNLRTLFVGTNDSLTINAGNTVSATTATDAGMITVDGTGAALLINGPVQVTELGLTATNGGLIQAGSLDQQTGASSAGGYTLGGGTIEIGNAGTALAGDLTIDRGYTVSGTGGLFLAGTILTPSPDVFDVVDNGLITSGSLQIGSLWESPGTAQQPDLPQGATTFALPDTLTGGGTVYVQVGGAINVVAAVNGSGLTFDLDNFASLNLFGPLAAGNTIAMKGFDDSLNIGNTYQGDTIDEALGPVVAATIQGFNAGDQITFQDSSSGNTPFDTVSFNNGTLSLLKGTSTFATLDLAGDYTRAVFSVSRGNVAGEAVQVVTASGPIVACFRAGTRILTSHGEVAVEQLHPGDQIEVQLGGAPTPITWIGYRTIDCTRHPPPNQVWPVRISTGAFSPDQPRRDLFLSPDHAVFANDVLIPVKHLINGTSVEQEPMDEVTYYHLELPQHDVVLAEGMPAESYLDTGDRSNFANGGGMLRLFPDFSADPQYASGVWEAYGCARLVVTGPEVAAVRERLEERVGRAASKSRKAARARQKASADVSAEPARRSRRG
ncbi:MAG: hypothetical protein JWQ55_3944, partial [Rhodopila sp.]|nr:hypothetical protein [Rhodopila sp.]